MERILEAIQINKHFNTDVPFHVLKDISLHINKSEFVSIMGKSGSGKSTLLYVLSTMDTDYEGNLYISGGKVTGKSGAELSIIRNEQIGFIFQFHYLLQEFTVLENVMLPALKLDRLSRKEIESNAMDKLQLLGIRGHAHKLASKISGGEKQRVAIARALINEPMIIMADEPTGNLDSMNAENVFGILKQLSDEQQLSLLVVTHDHDFADKTDRIIQMEDGYIRS